MWRFYINMGKRFILSILALFIFAGASLAYENPRWFSMPVKIYSANSENSMLISRAAQSWQTSSGGTVRFTCNNSKNLESLSNITISFINESSGVPYYINQQYSMFSDKRISTPNGFFYKLNINIYTKNSEGKAYSQSQLYSITLKAIGEAVGVKPHQEKGVMGSNNDKFSITTVSSDDIKALNKVYKK